MHRLVVDVIPENSERDNELNDDQDEDVFCNIKISEIHINSGAARQFPLGEKGGGKQRVKLQSEVIINVEDFEENGQIDDI